MKTRTTNAVRALGALMLCAGLLLSGCYDDSALRDQIAEQNQQLEDHERRLDSLELLCARLNTNYASLKTIVDALEQNDYVTGFAPIMEGTSIIGYTITFKKSGSVTIYNGAVPLLKVESGKWVASYDGGVTWQEIGEAATDDDQFISNVEVDARYLTLTLSDGQTYIKIPIAHLPPIMTVEMGYRHIRFSGKIDPSRLSIDTRVGVFNCREDNTSIWDAGEENWTNEFSEDGSFEIVCGVDEYGYSGCDFICADGETIYYRTSLYSSNEYIYSELLSVVWDKSDAVMVAEVSDLIANSAVVKGTVSFKNVDQSAISLFICEADHSGEYEDWSTERKFPVTLKADGSFSITVSDLKPNTKYFCSWSVDLGLEIDGNLESKYEKLFDFTTPLVEDLSVANSHIVSKSGRYKFKTVKGNSSESVGVVASAEVLWESFGTDVTPNVGDLIKSVSYEDGHIAFQTADTFKEGNAVIAAKDASGTILWSWHIWFTDQPQGQEYFNNAGTMMDRNLGATYATPGDVCALGLLYQWGRKDPFLGSSSIHLDSMAEAESTITWPSAVSSDSSTGTIAYATAHPTTFITYNSSNGDWYYNTSSWSTDNTRWTTSESNKSIYDPCPSGWRVPDGGDDGVWSKALGSSLYFNGYPYDSTNEGMNFSGKFGSASSIWYPASGCRFGDGSLDDVGGYGYCWSASPDNYDAYYLHFFSYGYVYPSFLNYRAYGLSVRCLQE